MATVTLDSKNFILPYNARCPLVKVIIVNCSYNAMFPFWKRCLPDHFSLIFTADKTETIRDFNTNFRKGFELQSKEFGILHWKAMLHWKTLSV